MDMSDEQADTAWNPPSNFQKELIARNNKIAADDTRLKEESKIGVPILIFISAVTIVLCRIFG